MLTSGPRATARILAVVIALTASASLVGCSASVPEQAAQSPGASGTPTAGLAPAAASTTYRIVAAGDIACPPGSSVTPVTCRQADTARLAAAQSPHAVVPLGDLQYERGSLADFQGSYASSWGSLKSITRPVVGNHEYKTAGAAGYYAYFGRKSPGYYAWNAGSWRIYSLNSNCSIIDCAAETAWLRRDMDANPRKCQIITMHGPRFSSGLEHGNAPYVAPFWRVAYNHRADIALAGHDHDYERFVRMAPDGTKRPYRGIRSFVVGTGGKSLYHLGTRKPGSAYFQATRFGVLRLDLGASSYTWRYITTDGVVRDQGTSNCL
ncbi:metallophosphoesterase family protein [Nocardioides cavernaquae]|uniref:metallophosphoesterase family protein n=1 Tax=Nocardioides cavernaquae TaxID=2321396 RepID=UPI0015FFF0E0|nr:metallophosphoesterase [Nocardioides cavernaquae]